jgi:hypothetical protein
VEADFHTDMLMAGADAHGGLRTIARNFAHLNAMMDALASLVLAP